MQGSKEYSGLQVTVPEKIIIVYLIVPVFGLLSKKKNNHHDTDTDL